jgi:hypothetical protein
MRWHDLLFAAVVLAATLCGSPAARADDFHWIGAGTGGNTATGPADPTTQWNNPDNWLEGSAPGPEDAAYLPLANAGYVNAQSGTVWGVFVDGPSAAGAYHIGDGAEVTILPGSSLSAGYHAKGRVVQTGGSLTVTNIGALMVGGSAATGQGYYDLQGGTLSVTGVSSAEYIGWRGTGVFTQTGGTHIVDSALYVGRGESWAPGNGTLNVGGGTLQAGTLYIGDYWSSAALNITDSAARIEANLTLGPNSIITAVPGSAIHVYYAYHNYSKDESALAGLANLALMYDVAQKPSSVQIEVAGMDFGAVTEGFQDNFTLGTLVLGGEQPVRGVLFDLVDNGNRSSAECLYVHNITIGAGSELDLNGYHVYYDGALVNNGSVVGGTPAFVPEPSALVLLAAGTACAASPGIRKRGRRPL